MGRTISEKEKVIIRLSFVEQSLATGLFIGHVPFAPATWACAISFIIWYFVHPVLWLYLAIIVALFLLGVYLSRKFEKAYGQDPHCVVIDEYTCFLIPLLFIPRSLLFVGISFILFRIFDILKPPPLRGLERVPFGWGVMLDDLGAAVYTSIIIIVLRVII